MHQIKRDREPHLGSGKCILKNLIKKEILMDYRPSPHLRHFQNDKSQRLFIPPLSLSFPVSLSLFLCLLSFSSHEPWLSIVRDYRSIAGLWPVEDLLLIFICIWNKPILSCRWAAEPCGPILCIYMQEPVCVAFFFKNLQYVCVCTIQYLRVLCLCVCECVCAWVPVFPFGTHRLTLRRPRPPEPPVMYQRPRVVFPTRVWSLAGLLALCLQG